MEPKNQENQQEQHNYDTIEPESLKFNREPLGRGAFGEVFCAELHRPINQQNNNTTPRDKGGYPYETNTEYDDQEYVAVKFSTVYNQNNNKLREAHEKEIQMLAKCVHPYIVKFYGVVESGYTFKEIGTKHSRGIILECADMNLYEMLHAWEDRGPMDATREEWDMICGKQWRYTTCHVFMWVHQIVTALEYLVSINVVHRDLKPHNILMYDYGRLCKITDFGIACDIKTQMTSGK